MRLERHITVQELIDMLMALEDKTAKVDTDGCDCTGPSDGIEEYETSTGKRVLICRNDSLPKVPQ